MKKVLFVVFPLLLLMALVAACGSSEPDTFEVTRVVVEEVPVTVEVPVEVVAEVPVTVEVPVEVLVEVPVEVEVTRIVEVVATPVVTTTTVVTTAVTTATEAPAATSEPAVADNIYRVQPNDNLGLIAAKTSTAVADIRAANNLTNSSVILVGQELIIPGWDGTLIAITAPAVPTTAPVATSEPTAEAASPTAVSPVGQTNLFPNPSFEGDWYFHIYNELQIPDGWQIAIDEGPNTLEPGAGGVFNRPEVRVVPSTDLPPSEHSRFIFDGNKTIKAFKGGAPTSFSIFADVPLPPGNYQFRANFFPDTVLAYEGSGSVYATDPLSAEVRIIHNNGGTGWQPAQIGQRNTLTYDFTVSADETVRLGVSFRNRFVTANNGWFIDDWALYAMP
ncbi:MAG: LysM peptidoglycan-binding domain-containing protein [Anaerolineales bacterium]|nr:LysM peptidoglycan-binding domain-containing protein [Anaerolineales bacterium]